MANRYLHCLQDLKNSADKILFYATKGNWEALGLESVANELIYAEFSTLSAAAISGTEKKEAAALIKEIRRINNEITERVKPRLTDLHQLLSEMSKRLPA
ncbi:MAG: flagellar protein FliT [Betaproteobacteria bacterium]|jgi:hypothetical protein|uniref:Flagellar protein FliT n=1 Tax=Candidatus Proximibacter danicus TaxID=2954365 RepID=A0A9D7K1H9_9PROT|nr:flagellar protein FliT [Candidatus Proximibacter danicus]